VRFRKGPLDGTMPSGRVVRVDRQGVHDVCSMELMLAGLWRGDGTDGAETESGSVRFTATYGDSAGTGVANIEGRHRLAES